MRIINTANQLIGQDMSLLFLSIVNAAKIAFYVAFILAFLVDTCLLYLIIIHNIDLNNSYCVFHKKNGLFKITALKSALIAWFIIILLFEPSVLYGTIFSVITTYCIVVIKLFIDFRKAV